MVISLSFYGGEFAEIVSEHILKALTSEGEVKNKADFVTLSNNGDGIAHMLEILLVDQQI
ncbi:hypothetical protein ACWOAH_11075 [Vagococcus vulneris]|uniref:Uncharacterized protein n=1 Tax=Vagococcus vulneris TaxID=1977869 RepID=A0A429ZRP0_9ENTE|nr:hypothetical protein [Vagococcus vulneris]RST96394.1 hypothetical protein CBF37_11125 [Vagococcus vulneris]